MRACFIDEDVLETNMVDVNDVDAHAYLDDEANAGRTPRLQRARVAELEANREPRSTPAGAECLGARSTARAQL